MSNVKSVKFVFKMVTVLAILIAIVLFEFLSDLSIRQQLGVVVQDTKAEQTCQSYFISEW